MIGTTNAINAKDLSGWFNVKSVSGGDGLASEGGSFATGANGVYILMGGWTPSASSTPFNYTSINTYTTILSGH